ncbi:MAG: hypothetical protein R8G66_26470 [Cytophagales bacterium]|nr:hypothetical protein [Cytophagales bacterium]
MRKVLFGFCCLLSWSLFGQNLHLDQTLYLSGDTVQGVAYFQEAALVPYAYHLSLFDDNGNASFNKIVWVPATGVEFFLPLDKELGTGKYTLQLSNYQNGMITHAEEVWIVNPENGSALDTAPDAGQIGTVIKQGNALDVMLFETTDSIKYTAQVLQGGSGEKPVPVNPGESHTFETKPATDVRVSVRDELFRVYNVRESITDRGLSFESQQNGGALNMSLRFDEPMEQVSVSVTDLSQSPAKNAYPILPNDATSNCKELPNHSRLNVGLKTWLRGFQLTGTLSNTADGTKIIDQRLIMSNPQDDFDLKYTASNEQGRFGFYNLDFEGTKTLYLSQTGEGVAQAKFEFAPPRSFLVSPFPVCAASYATTADELNEMVRLRLLNRKVAERFLQFRELPTRKAIYTPEPLFNDADNTILLSDYVEFGTMKEVIKEIIPYVFMTKKGIGVFSVDQKKSFKPKPLILINGVPVPYEEIVMGLQPTEIHSVQVLNKLSTIAPYGNLALGGIVSIVMKDQFDFPNELESIEVEGYFKSKAPKAPEKVDGVPYFPALVHWQADVPVDQNGNASIDFLVPDYGTNVGVEVMGITSTGRVITRYEVINLSKAPK